MKNSVMTTIVILCLMIVSACSNDDDNQSEVDGVSQIDSDQGFNFTLTYPDGREIRKTGRPVFGSFNNQLLDGDYSKSLNGGAEGFRFYFKFSLPKDVQSGDVIEGTHQLRDSRLRLEQTGNLGALQTEFWLGTADVDDEFDGLKNATGTVKYQQDITAIDERIAIAVEIDVSVINRQGEIVKIIGTFWKAKDDNI